MLTIVVLTLGGWWADGRLGTDPWLLFLGLGLGFGAGLYHLNKEAGRKKGDR